MRKILLGTTAVAGAALFAVSTAQAQQAPTVRIGGYVEFNAGIINDSMDKAQAGVTGTPGATAPNRNSLDFRQGDTEIHVFVTGKAANGLSYGATLEIQFDGMDNVGGAGVGMDTDEAYIFISSPTLGTIRLGDEDSAASLLQTRVPSVTGSGPDGMWDEFAARSPDGQAPYLISGINDGSDATKVIYLSPQFFGFDFGLSFAPNGREGESFRNPTGAALQRDPTDSIQNELSYALRYRGTFGGVGVAATFAGMQAEPAAQAVRGAAATQQDITAYHIGMNLTAFGVTVGGEYNWGKYAGASTGRTALNNGLGESSNWAIGATYTTGALAVGAFYGVGERDNGRGAAGALNDRKQTAWGIAAVYTLAPGLDLVANYTRIEDRNLMNALPVTAATNAIALRERNIDAFILGTRIAF